MKTHPLKIQSLLAVLAAAPAFAVTDTWDGNSPNAGAGDSNLTTALNWADNTAPLSDLVNTDLVFAGTTKLTPSVNVAFSTNSLTFNNTAGAFTFGGNTLSIGAGGIVNNDADTMAFFNVVSFASVANSTINVASGGLTFNNTTSLPTGTLTVDGAGATSFRSFTGSSALTKQGAGTMSWGPSAVANQFDLTVAAGTLSTIADATTDLFSGTGSIAVTGTGVLNIGEDLTLSGVTLTRASSAGLTIAATKQLRVESGGDVIITGAFSQTTNSDLVVTGAGSTFSTTSTLALNGGSATNVLSGGSLSSGAAAITIGSGTGGLVTITGSGSSLTGGNLDVGLSGGAGVLTFQSGSTGAFAGIDVDNSGVVGTDGELRVQSGSSVTGTALMVAPSAVANSGTVTVGGAGSVLTITGAGATTLGTASASTGTLEVETGGIFNSGTGVTPVNATGTVAITGGTFNANGSMTLRGQLTRDATGTFTLAAGRTLTVESGGDATVTGAFTNATGSTITVTGAGSTFTTTTSHGIHSGGTMNVLAGGTVVSNSGAIDIGTVGNGTVTVNSVGSLVAGVTLRMGTFGGAGNLTFSNEGDGTLSGAIELASGLTAGSAIVNVQSGSGLNAGSLKIGSSSVASTATMTITGAGSEFSIPGSGTTVIGAASASTATLNVQSGGTFSSGPGASISVGTTGVVAINGGTFNANGPTTVSGQVTQDAAGLLRVASGETLTVAGGGVVTLAGAFELTGSGTVNMAGGTLTVNNVPNFTNPWTFTSGVLNLLGTNNLTVGTGGLLGTDLTLSPGRLLTVANTTTVDFTRTLTLNGGSLSTGTLANNGTFDFQKGTLAITGAAGLNIGSGVLGANVTLGTGANLQVTNTAVVSSGASLLVDGGSVTAGVLNNSGLLEHVRGALNVSGNATNLTGADFFASRPLTIGGTFTNQSGGRLTLQNGTGRINGAGSLINAGLITGDGTIALPVTNLASGDIRAESGRTLYFTNTLATNQGELILQNGTLDFAGTVTNSATGFISGRGALYTGGLTNNGVMAFSAGNTDIRGDTTNAAGARIVTSGAGAVTTFFDDVVHNGQEIFTGANANTVFFGAQTGSGSFTGTGAIYFIGDLRPGSSPAAITYAPQVILAPSTSVTVEIGGTAAGTQHDKLTFTHAATPQVIWGGELIVTLINGFTPAAGQSFDIFDFDPARDADTFAAVNLPALPAGLAWDTSELYNTGIISIIPGGLTFAAWASASGIPGALPGGDHDNDGYDNAAEFALGLFPPQPGTVEPTGGFHTYVEGQRLRVLFTRPLDRTGVTLRVQAADDLATWTDVAVSVDSAPFTGAGFVSENRAHPLPDPGLVEVRDILNTSTTPRRQMRLHISLTP